jgi:hypothetical protein
VGSNVPVQLLRLLSNLDLLPFLFYIMIRVSVCIDGIKPVGPEDDDCGRRRGKGSIPKSAMLKIPGTLELALRFPSSLAGVPAIP